VKAARWRTTLEQTRQRARPEAGSQLRRSRESCVNSCDYQLLGGSSSVAGRATKQSAPNVLNPQIAIQKNVSWVKRKLGDSPDETAFFRWPLQRLLERIGFRDVRIDPSDFLHPKTPRLLVSRFNALGRLFEMMPVVSELAGSLYKRAVK